MSIERRWANIHLSSELIDDRRIFTETARLNCLRKMTELEEINTARYKKKVHRTLCSEKFTSGTQTYCAVMQLKIFLFYAPFAAEEHSERCFKFFQNNNEPNTPRIALMYETA